jgi:hypothetical protein
VDIAAWLHDLGLEQYEPAFRANEIDAKVLPSLTSEDLREIGVVLIGHRRRLLEASPRSTAPSLPLPRMRGREGWGRKRSAAR